MTIMQCQLLKPKQNNKINKKYTFLVQINSSKFENSIFSIFNFQTIFSEMSSQQETRSVDYEDEEPLLPIPRLNESSSSNNSPSSRRPLLISVFFLLGVGSLVPWNFLITPKDYWLEKLRSQNQTNSDQLNELQKFWESSLSIAAMLPNTIFASLTCFGWIKGSLKFRILTALMVIITCLVFNNVFVYK